MTRKDYRALATAIAEVRSEGGDQKTLNILTMKLSRMLYADNPRFDQGRFVAAALSAEPTPEEQCTHWLVGAKVGIPGMYDLRCTLPAGHPMHRRESHAAGSESWSDAAGEYRPDRSAAPTPERRIYTHECEQEYATDADGRDLLLPCRHPEHDGEVDR